MRLRESLTLPSQRTKRADADDQRNYGQRRRYPEGKHIGRDCRKRLKTFTDGLVLFENASRFFRNDAIREV